MALSSSPGVTACILESLESMQEEKKDTQKTEKRLVMPHIDVPSLRRWTICATSVGSRHYLVLPAVPLSLDKCKTSEKPVRKDQGRKNVSSLQM